MTTTLDALEESQDFKKIINKYLSDRFKQYCEKIKEDPVKRQKFLEIRRQYYNKCKEKDEGKFRELKMRGNLYYWKKKLENTPEKFYKSLELLKNKNPDNFEYLCEKLNVNLTDNTTQTKNG